MQEMKACKYCGKKFLSVKSNHVYCCSYCSKQARNKLAREEGKKEIPKPKPKKKDRITEINEAAKAAGMSYGKYVAMQYAEKT